MNLPRRMSLCRRSTFKESRKTWPRFLRGRLDNFETKKLVNNSILPLDWLIQKPLSWVSISEHLSSRKTATFSRLRVIRQVERTRLKIQGQKPSNLPVNGTGRSSTKTSTRGGIKSHLKRRLWKGLSLRPQQKAITKQRKAISRR